jgi:hypothetical protein
VSVVSIATAHAGTSALIHVFECQTAGRIEKFLRLFSWVVKSKRSIGTKLHGVLLYSSHVDITTLT